MELSPKPSTCHLFFGILAFAYHNHSLCICTRFPPQEYKSKAGTIGRGCQKPKLMIRKLQNSKILKVIYEKIIPEFRGARDG